MQRYTIFFITVNALLVSGGFSAHHQELKTVHTASGICQACLLLPLAVAARKLDILNLRCSIPKCLYNMMGKDHSNTTIVDVKVYIMYKYIMRKPVFTLYTLYIFLHLLFLCLTDLYPLSLTYTGCCVYSFELLMMGGETT
jgi:hypothetical protein